MPSLSTSEKLERVQARLKRGDFARVADRTGYDHSHVSRVLRGLVPVNEKIVNDAYSLFSKRKPVKA
jgi:hypothetical protein